MKYFSGLFLLMLFLGISFCAFAQDSLSAKKLFSDGDREIKNGRYRQALPFFLKLHESNPSHAEYNFLTGLCYLNSPAEKQKAIPFFERAKKDTAFKDYPYTIYYLGQAYHFANRFDDAVRMYEQFKGFLLLDKYGNELRNEVNRRIEMCGYGKMFVANPTNAAIKNLGSVVNSSYPDYAPVISSDEKIFIFTSRREGSTGKQLDENGEFYEDIYMCTNNEWQWTVPEKIDSASAPSLETKKEYNPEFSDLKKIKSINTRFHDASIGLSPDGQTLFIYRNEQIYASQRQGEKWAKPVKLNTHINAPGSRQASISITADGKTLYFSSNRKGGLGGLDIYKSEKDSSGNWGPAVNLGSQVNTRYDDDSPFIHPDGKTLYFASKGHNSMGGYDIFRSSYENGHWSAPQNMGYPVNTAADETHFVINARGDHAYMASIRDRSEGGMDIYLFLFPGVSVPVTELKGIVYSGDILNPLKACLKLTDITTGKEAISCNTSEQTGEYLTLVPPNKKYNFTITADGFRPDTEEIFIPDQKQFYQLFQQVNIIPLGYNGQVIGQRMLLKNVFFDIEKALRFDPEFRDKMPGEFVVTTQGEDAEKKPIHFQEDLGKKEREQLYNDFLLRLLKIYREYPEMAPVDEQGNSFADFLTDPAKYNEIERVIYYIPADSVISLLQLPPSQATLAAGLSNERLARLLMLSETNQEKIKSLAPDTFAQVIRLASDSMEKYLSGITVAGVEVAAAPVAAGTEKNVESAVMFKPVYFESNSTDINAENAAELDKLYAYLIDNPKAKVRIAGHCDNTGSRSLNQKLSEERAQNARAYLQKKGKIKRARVAVTGYGEMRPAAPNYTRAGRKLNRRVEIELLNKD